MNTLGNCRVLYRLVQAARAAHSYQSQIVIFSFFFQTLHLLTSCSNILSRGTSVGPKRRFELAIGLLYLSRLTADIMIMVWW
jgi:hypothetical protein